MINNKTFGKWGENKAKEYLLKLGYLLIAENWQNRYGEIDLIFLDNNQVVFVEVKTRRNSNYGPAIEAINKNKQLQIIKMVEMFLQYKNWWNKKYRIDVIAIDGDDNLYDLNHIKNAIGL